jgi:hypothetical protein
MTRTALSLASALFLSAAVVHAAPAKKAKPAAAVQAPAASAGEINKLKGDYKWGMTPDEVIGKVQDRIRTGYEQRLQKTAHDPSKHDRVRKEMMAEVEKAKSKVIKFDGQKTGYDVSIIDQEFLHGTHESMLVTKEETATRYFFFSTDRLYKMFIAFDKEMLQGKAFRDFGQLMQAKFGKAREVTVEEKSKAGVKVKLDHFIWSSKSGDMLRLVDRSEFYDVYCLVIYDGNIARQQDEVRKSRPVTEKRDSLVEAAAAAAANDRDAHDNIIDQISGKEIRKPGDNRSGNIVVPSPGTTNTNVRAPTPAEVNRPEPAEEEGGGKPKKGKAPKGSETNEAKGLTL